MRVQDYNSAEEEENENTNRSISKTNQSEGGFSMSESKARKDNSKVTVPPGQWLINLLALVAFVFATVCLVYNIGMFVWTSKIQLTIENQKNCTTVNQTIVYRFDDGQNVSNNSLRIKLDEIMTMQHDLKQLLQKLTDREAIVHERISPILKLK